MADLATLLTPTHVATQLMTQCIRSIELGLEVARAIEQLAWRDNYIAHATVVTQMTESAHRTYTKLIKYALRITSLQSGRVKYTRFSVCFTIDFLWIFVVFLVSVFLL